MHSFHNRLKCDSNFFGGRLNNILMLISSDCRRTIICPVQLLSR